jgi:maltooligosyltrehalose trehalohydrolase
MKRLHQMPFGAEYADGNCRFRLWAPARARVELLLDDSPQAMAARDGGWHELTLNGVAPGALYSYRVDDAAAVPDPASRANPQDADGPSAVVDPRAFEWTDDAWRGRPWHEAVLYELHIGTFTRAGTFAAAIGRLDYLAGIGITAIEVMPVAEFPGERNWGYDGVLPFAPDAAYGTPEDLKRFVVAAHERGLMVLLDVVYNHFGPQGNYLARYAPQFFDPGQQTPWGAAINFDGPDARTVRDFFVHNALYWIEEFHLDGLRLDAVHAIADESPRHIVAQIAEAIAQGPGRERQVHLVLENDRNAAALLDPQRGAHATAQWNDDWHHAAHVLLTGEGTSYRADYLPQPERHFARSLAEGFAYQGEHSGFRKAARGEPSRHLPPQAFIAFLQNHDQVGNRAQGERISALADPDGLRLASAILLLAPSVPMLFMGEEFDAATPFLYFCDYSGDLARAVREGRKGEFADIAGAGEVPDPNAPGTFARSKLDWDSLGRPAHAAALARYRALLALRREYLLPRFAAGGASARFSTHGAGAIAVDWTLGDGSRLQLRANLSARPAPPMPVPTGALLHAEGDCPLRGGLPPWGGTWTLDAA